MADISSMMDEMLQQMRDYRTANPPPQPGERQGALQALQQAQLTAGKDNRPGWQVLLEGRMLSPDLGNAQLTGYTAFKALDDWKKTQREMEFKRQVLAANTGYEDVLKRTDDAQKGMGGSGVMTQLAHAVLNPIQNIGGFGIDRLTGKVVVPKEFIGEYTRSYNKFLEFALQRKQPDAENWAAEQAMHRLQQAIRNPAIAGPASAQGEETGLPQGVGIPTAQPEMLEESAPGANFKFDVSKLSPETRSELQRQIARYKANPNAGTLEAVTQAIARAMANNQLGASPAGPPVASTPVNEPKLEGEKTAAKESAKSLQDYENTMVGNSDSANRMAMNLDKLRQEAKTANFGAGADFKTQALRWADTLGVQLSPEEVNAMNSNQVIGKIALQLATIGAKAISSRPTQLEFQKLLEQGVPASGMTKEAFMRVLDMFSKTVDYDRGQLTEYMRWKHNHPSGELAAGDFSDFWALKHDPRYVDITVQDIFDTMKARGWTWNQTLTKLRETK